MSVQETVRILRKFEETDGETLRAQYGAEAVAVAEDMARVLDDRLQSESTRRGTVSPYESLWPAFQTEVARLTVAVDVETLWWAIVLAAATSTSPPPLTVNVASP